MMNYNWTAERVDRLKTLHICGKPYSEIAAELGCPTRSVVSGKVFRRYTASAIKTALKPSHVYTARR